MKIKRLSIVAIGLCSSLAGAQSLPSLPRSNVASGLKDTALLLVSDTARRTRAATILDLRHTLSLSAFDSLITGKLNLTGATITGTPTWSSRQTFATGQVVDTAVMVRGLLVDTATLAKNLTGSPAITVSSCTGCGGAASFPLLGTNGSNTAPTYSFANSTALGLFRRGADSLGISVNGGQGVLNITGTGGLVTVSSDTGALTLATGGTSHRMTFQTTSSAGALNNVLRLNEVNQSLFRFGSATQPSITFAADSITGLYRFGVDTIGMTTAGVNSLQISGGATAKITGGAGNMTIQSGTGASRTLTLQTTTSGSTAKNILTLGADSTATFLGQIRPASGTNMGVGITNNYMYFSAAADTIAFVVAGTRLLNIRSGGLQVPSGTIKVPDGGAAGPGYAFTNSSGGLSGMYRLGTDSLGFSTGGVQSLVIGAGASTKLTGGAGNMTLQCGTGVSRTCTFQSTTSGGTAKSTLVLGADTSATFLGQILTNSIGTVSVPAIAIGNGFGGSGVYATKPGDFAVETNNVLAVRWNELQQSMFALGSGTNPGIAFVGDSATGWYRNSAGQWAFTKGGSDAMIVGAGGNRAVRIPSAGAASAPQLAVGAANTGWYELGASGANDTLATAVNGVVQMKMGTSGVLLLPSLPSEGSTKNAMCWDGTTFNVTQNAAATCTVSARRYKENIQPLFLLDAQRMVTMLKPSTYNEKVGHEAHIGLIAEEADSVDHRLASRDNKGRVNSVNYEQVTVLLLKVVQDQQRQLDSIKTILKAKKP